MTTESNINMEKIAEEFSKATAEAEEIVNDEEKTQKLLDDSIKKAKKAKGKLTEIWDTLMLMFEIVAAWTSGKYREIPTGSIIAIIGGLIYFLSPIDVIPDFIPIIGYIDDVFVIGLVYAQVFNDLEKFKSWKANHQELFDEDEVDEFDVDLDDDYDDDDDEDCGYKRDLRGRKYREGINPATGEKTKIFID